MKEAEGHRAGKKIARRGRTRRGTGSALVPVEAAQMGKDAGSDPFRLRLPIGGDRKVGGFLCV